MARAIVLVAECQVHDLVRASDGDGDVSTSLWDCRCSAKRYIDEGI